VTPPIELTGVVKDYRGLRPLRIENLRVESADRIALVGVDQPAAEVLVNLITGTTLADRGTVRIFGKSTSDIQDSTEWLAVVDRFGIVSERAVLLDGLSAVQNLSIPFSLEIEPPAPDVLVRAGKLAEEVGLPETVWNASVAQLDGAARARVRLGRALALDPEVLLLEHPTAAVSREEVERLGRDITRIAERRAIAALALTADSVFADAFAPRVMTLDPASGRLEAARSGWFSRLRR
jgi:predicted ABC-type transport system involved in lysophospholipase L1 biosynthesis ATPase subunit